MIAQLPTGIESPGKPAIDPVCGMEVDPANSEYQLDRGDQVIRFCSAGCRAKFVADPINTKRPAGHVSKPADPKIAGAAYTCPMHPQIRRDAPGSCPICGMPLELRAPNFTAQAQSNAELTDMTRWL